jgi:RNA recognition motif-containing protein
MSSFASIPEDLAQYPIYVSNLSYTMEEHELKALFAQTGEILSARVFTGPSQRKTGSAIVNYRSKASAVRAMRKFNEMFLNGRTIYTEWGKDIAEKYLTPQAPPIRRSAERTPQPPHVPSPYPPLLQPPPQYPPAPQPPPQYPPASQGPPHYPSAPQPPAQYPPPPQGYPGQYPYYPYPYPPPPPGYPGQYPYYLYPFMQSPDQRLGWNPPREYDTNIGAVPSPRR